MLVPVLLNPVLLDPVLRIRGRRLDATRLNGNRLNNGGNLLIGCWDMPYLGICLAISPGRRLGGCPGIRLGVRLGYRAVQRQLLRGGTPLPRDGALALLDRGDQVILAHTGDVGDAHLTSELAQLSHHHSGQPGTATRRRPVIRRRHSASSLVDWALFRRFRSSNVAAQQVDIVHAGPS
jgi:hypothetical protein